VTRQSLNTIQYDVLVVQYLAYCVVFNGVRVAQSLVYCVVFNDVRVAQSLAYCVVFNAPQSKLKIERHKRH
jgi:hypothetical protein